LPTYATRLPSDSPRLKAASRVSEFVHATVNFQEVVHSVRTGNADLAKDSDSRRTE
jgi:hypothetical protein